MFTALEKLLVAAREFIVAIVNAFGPVPTFLLIVLIIAIVVYFRVRSENRKNQEFDALQESHQDHLATLKDQNRHLTSMLFQREGWPEEAIRKIFVESDHEDAIEAQDILRAAGFELGHGDPPLSPSAQMNPSRRDNVDTIGSSDNVTDEVEEETLYNDDESK